MKSSTRYLLIFISLFLWSSVSSAYNLITTTNGSNIKWGATTALGTSGGIVEWSYNEAQFDALFPSGTNYLSEINNAFSVWSSIADITFVNVTSGGDIQLKTSPIDNQFDILAQALVFFTPTSNPSVWSIVSSEITFDSLDFWKTDFGEPSDSFDLFQVLSHEIGHAIGIDHVSSDTISALMNPFYTEGFRGLQADDIAAAQALYGLSAVPLPAAFWLFATGLGLLISRGKYKTFQSH